MLGHPLQRAQRRTGGVPRVLHEADVLKFDFAASGRFESAAVIGILIALISLLMTAIAFKVGARLGVKR